MYTLYYYPRNASWAPHLLLAEMGVDFELVLVDRQSNEQKSPDYLLLNPTGRIPTLHDHDMVIFESAAICLYLCEKHPQLGFIPNINTAERAQFYQWLFYLNATVQPELLVYCYPKKHTKEKEAKDIAMAQESRLTEMFSLIDRALMKKDFLVGSRISACDYFLFMLSHWASGMSNPPLSYRNLGRYLRDIAKRETVLTVCEREGTGLEQYH